MSLSLDSLMTVSDVARALGANPRDVSDLFYRRVLRDDLAPIVGGRRLIPRDYVNLVGAALRRAGRPVNHAPTALEAEFTS